MDITLDSTSSSQRAAHLMNSTSMHGIEMQKIPHSTRFDKLQEKQSQWKTIGVKVRYAELPLLNRQLDRLNYVTLGELVKDLISGKISRITEDQEIEIMKTNLQGTGQATALEGKPCDFYKQIDVSDFQNYLKGKYHEHTVLSELL